MTSDFDNKQVRYGRNTTVEEVIAGIDLGGKLAVVTGGAGGLGKETARALALAGAHVFIGGRDEQKLLTAKREIAAIARYAHISEHPLDLMSLSSIAKFAQAVRSLERAVDILVCNAGIMACPQTYSVYGIESQLMTNYVGHAALTSLLSPMLRRAGGARFVSLTSSGHQLSPVVISDLNFRTRRYDKWQAYGQSKTACALLAVYVQQRLRHAGVTAFAVHPGVIHTDLARHLETEEFDAIVARMEGRGKSLSAGAATSVWAAVAKDLEGRGPLYLEDCQMATRLDVPNDLLSGVMPYAMDPQTASELWKLTEQMIGEELPL